MCGPQRRLPGGQDLPHPREEHLVGPWGVYLLFSWTWGVYLLFSS